LNAVLNEALALLIALVFTGAAIAKLKSWSELPGVVQNFRVLPHALIFPLAVVLPPLEAAIGVGILIRDTRSLAAGLAAILFMVFGAALAINLVRGRRYIDCGCFRSNLKQPISIATILRNVLLAACALLSVPRSAAAALSPFAWAIAIAGAVTLFLCYLSVGLLFRAPPPSYEDNFMQSGEFRTRNLS
jgi:hypothetical protein